MDKSFLKKSLKINFLAILTGCIAGYGAILFRFMIGFLQNIIFHKKLDFHLISPMNNSIGYWVIIVVPIGLIIASYLVKIFAQEAKGHGVPEVIEAVLTKAGVMRKRVVIIKALASSITIAFGGSVGREGPIVQMGASAGSTLGQIFKLKSRDLIILVGCGAAGAIGATFNTPIAGVIFAIELILLELKAKSFIPLVIASVFATMISRFHLGNELAFMVPKFTLTHPTEILFYLGLGILAGVVGILMVRTLYKVEDIFEINESLPFIAKPIIGGLILGGIGFFYPQLLGVGYESVSNVMNEHMSLSLMLILIFSKIIATSLTMGAGGSGGVFAPSLFVGAMLGGAYGSIIHRYFPDISSSYGAYALVGMAALFSSTSRATFTAIVILFEMTLDYSIILPLMFTCVIADQVSVFLSGEGTIYSIKLMRRGITFISGFGVNIYETTSIKEIMTRNVKILLDDMKLGEATAFIKKYSYSSYPVTTVDGVLIGILTAQDLLKKAETHGKNAIIKRFVHDKPSIVYPNTTVANSLKKLKRIRDPRVIVIERSTKKILGIVTPSDFVRLQLF